MAIRCIFNAKFVLPSSKNWDFFTNTSNSSNTFNNYITRKMKVVKLTENLNYENIIEIKKSLANENYDERVDWWEKNKNIKYNMNSYMGNNLKTDGIITKNSLSDFKIEDHNPKLFVRNNEIEEAHPNSIAWVCVTSFDEQSSSNYDLEKNQHIIAEKMFNCIMHENNMNKKDFTWKSAFHVNTAHHHMHMTIYQPKYVSDEKIIARGKLSPKTYIAMNLEMNKIVQKLSMFFEPMNKLKVEMIRSFQESLKIRQEVINETIEINKTLKKLNKEHGRLNYKSLPENIKKTIDNITNKICIMNETPIELFKDQVDFCYDQYLDKIIKTGSWENKNINIGNSEQTLKDLKNYVSEQKEQKINEIYKDFGNVIIKFIKDFGQKLEINNNINNKQHDVAKNFSLYTKNKINYEKLDINLIKINKNIPDVFPKQSLENSYFSKKINMSSISGSLKAFQIEISKDIDEYWKRVHNQFEIDKGYDYENE